MLVYNLDNALISYLIDGDYQGYVRLHEKTCYKQMRGPHPTITDAINECNIIGSKCNGIQKVKCIDGTLKITKSPLKTLCVGKHQYTSNPNCNVTILAKGKNYCKMVV